MPRRSFCSTSLPAGSACAVVTLVRRRLLMSLNWIDAVFYAILKMP